MVRELAGFVERDEVSSEIRQGFFLFKKISVA